MNTDRSQTSRKQILCKHAFIGKVTFISVIVARIKLHKIQRKVYAKTELSPVLMCHRYLSYGKHSFDKYSLLLVAKIFFLAAVSIKKCSIKGHNNSINKWPCHSSSFLLSQYPTVMIFTNVITKGHKG